MIWNNILTKLSLVGFFIDLLKVNNRNTRRQCEICSKLAVKWRLESFMTVEDYLSQIQSLNKKILSEMQIKYWVLILEQILNMKLSRNTNCFCRQLFFISYRVASTWKILENLGKSKGVLKSLVKWQFCWKIMEICHL